MIMITLLMGFQVFTTVNFHAVVFGLTLCSLVSSYRPSGRLPPSKRRTQKYPQDTAQMSMMKTVTAGFSKMLATKKHGATKNRR